MNDTPHNWSPEQAAALRRLRIVWAVTLVSILPLPFVILPITGSGWIEERPDGAAAQTMVIGVVIGLAALLVGLFARNQAYKANWQGDAVAPSGYVKGNTLFFGAVCSAAVAVFVVGIVQQFPAPTFAAAPVFIGLLIFNFPNGKPMLPAPPRLDLEGDAP